METIVLQEAAAAAVEAPKAIVYYAFACKYSKKWFITRSRRRRFKQLILLYKLGCIPSTAPLYFPESHPVVGGIYADTEGNHIECVEVEWI